MFKDPFNALNLTISLVCTIWVKILKHFLYKKIKTKKKIFFYPIKLANSRPRSVNSGDNLKAGHRLAIEDISLYKCTKVAQSSVSCLS